MATPTESERIPTNEEFEICATIDRWRREMARQIETIDRCRRGNLSYGQILGLVDLPVQLATDSKTLIRVLAHREPDLDNKPFEKLSKAIETWCSSYDVSKLPPQNDLWRLFEAAEAICTTLESDIIHRAIKGEPPWEQMAAAHPGAGASEPNAKNAKREEQQRITTEGQRLLLYGAYQALKKDHGRITLREAAKLLKTTRSTLNRVLKWGDGKHKEICRKSKIKSANDGPPRGLPMRAESGRFDAVDPQFRIR